MCKLIEIIKNVDNVKLIDNKLCFWKNDAVFYNNTIIYSGDIFHCENFKNIFIISINSGESSVYINLKKDIEKVFLDIKGADTFLNEEEIIYGNWNKDYSKRFITRINLSTKHKKWTIESYFGNGLVSDNYLYASCINNRICKIDLDSPAQPLWQYSIAHFPNYINGFGDEVPADIEQIIGIYNNLLWVILGAKTLIALNIKTGTLEHTFENIVRGMGDIHLDEQKGVLKILGGHNYEEFDLNKLVLTEKYRDKDEKLFIRSCNFYPGDDNLYFCAVNNWPDNTSFNAFGVFNTIQNRVIWLQEQQDDWGLFYNPPQANQKQLAILDDKGNLLIFEKEDIIGKASLSNT